jgi:hypothetical protein
MTRVSSIVAYAGIILLAASTATASLFQINNPIPSAAAAFGTGLAGVGDQNGDGIPDLAVGSPGADRVDIISGANRSMIRSLHDPEGLPGMRFGFAVCAVGDVNGDGVEDIAVGAPGPPDLLPLPCDPMLGQGPCPPPEWGRVFIFSGANGSMIRKIVPASTDFLAFGLSLAALGDVNGDGVPDLAVGSPVLLKSWGQVYAFSGATGAQLWILHEPPFPADRQAIASLGLFISAIGDINGDGKKDLIVAAPFFDNDPGLGSVLGGKVFLVSGANGSIIRSHQAPAPIDNGYFGGSVSGIGDQNGDGVEDYLIGNRGGNEIRLYSGATGALIRAIPSPASLADGHVSFARAGDRDGDSKEDFWAGVPKAGAAFLMNGKGTILNQVSDPGASGGTLFDMFAARLASVPDLNGDGKPEVMIGKASESVGGLKGAGAVFLVTSNLPPVADAGPDQNVAADAQCVGNVALDGSGSSDPDGDPLTYVWTGPFGTVTGVNPLVTLPLGTHIITLTVYDGQGGVDSDTVTITVTDQSPPTISSVNATPNELWPPDHRMVAIFVSVVAADNCDPAPKCRIIGVTSNEPVNGLGDGDTAPDWEITGDLTLNLRSERSGKGTGRVYTITVEFVDSAGNRSTATLEVRVPKDRKKP